MWIVKDAAKAASVRHLNLNLVLRRLSSALSHNADNRHTSKLQKVSPSSSVLPLLLYFPPLPLSLTGIAFDPRVRVAICV